MECRELAKDIAGDQWTISKANYVTMEELWTWENLYGINTDGDAYLGMDKCIKFEKEIWFELGKSMWKKHRCVFQDHVKYIHNYMVKPF